MDPKPKGRPRILHVEDVATDRVLLELSLEENPIAVITAAASTLSGAREILKTRADEFDLVVLDVVIGEWKKIEDTIWLAREFIRAGKRVIVETATTDYLPILREAGLHAVEKDPELQPVFELIEKHKREKHGQGSKEHRDQGRETGTGN